MTTIQYGSDQRVNSTCPRHCSRICLITTTTISPPTVEAILVKVYDIKTWIKYFQESVSMGRLDIVYRLMYDNDVMDN